MRFSIVVPFRNAERFLEGCIRSLLDQKYPDDRYEILLVDNASSDRSVALARQHPAVRLLHQPQVGAYAARNLGLDHARGEIIAFIDSDCEADPGWLLALERALRDPEIGVVLGRREFPVTAGPLKWLQAFEHHKADWVFGLPEPARYYGYTNNMAARAALFDRLGRFAEVRRGADTVWVQAAARRFSPRAVCFTADALVHHMEITSLAQYYQKMWLYGRSSRRNRSRINRSPTQRGVSTRDRLQIYRRTVAAERYGWAAASTLLLILTTGGLCFDLAARWPLGASPQPS